MSGWDSKDGGLGMAFLWATETPQAEKEMTRGTKKKKSVNYEWQKKYVGNSCSFFPLIQVVWVTKE